VIIDKRLYAGVVRNTVKMMVRLSEEHTAYDAHRDLVEYYHETIEKEGVLSQSEFLTICNEAMQKPVNEKSR